MSDEQQEEIGILESIYPDELEIHSDTRYSVHLRLETTPPRQLRISVDYPAEYPEVVPILDIDDEEVDEEEVDEEEDPRAEADFVYDFTSDDLKALRKSAAEIAEENLGLPSVFTIISQIKDTAEELYADKIKEMELAKIKQLEIAEAKEQEKFHGTPVTKESYAAWRAKFRAEMGLDKDKERPFGRSTGREIFERGEAEEEDEDQEEEAEDDN